MKKLSYIFILVLTIVMASCEQNIEYDKIGENKTDGEWMVKAYVNGTNIFGSFPIRTYKTISGKDSLYINDYEGRFWDFNVKAAVKTTDNTFQTQRSVNIVSGKNIGVKVLNGRIINNDSIYMEIQFEDDETPYGVTYQLAGHRTK
ncbi:MAG: hypothetical protein H6Q19_325 [Bacteroidetes bacterium]|nr:hypothetical protein [Bacteroidota bacterium]